MAKLPPRYYSKPNQSLFGFILSLVTLAVVVAGLPISVFLVGQRTHSLPEAASPLTRVGQTSFTLVSSSSSTKEPPVASRSGQLAITVLARSDDVYVNLFAARINFPKDLLQVDSILTSPDLADKWLESSFDNQNGRINLIAGATGQGVKTDPDLEYTLARVVFDVKATGIATLYLDPDSTIFKTDNQTLLGVRKNDLTVNLPEPAATVQCQARPACLDTKPSCKIAEPVGGWCPKSPQQRPKDTASLKLLSPIGGETLPYNARSTIRWSGRKVKQVSVFLLQNRQRLGRIASLPAALGQVDFRPSDVLLPTFITPTNTYQVEIEGLGDSGERLVDRSAGPFAIVASDVRSAEASQSANLAQRGGDANRDGVVDLTDLSILLKSYGRPENLDLGVDLNGDGLVNDVDLYLMRNLLFKNVLPKNSALLQ